MNQTLDLKTIGGTVMRHCESVLETMLIEIGAVALVCAAWHAIAGGSW